MSNSIYSDWSPSTDGAAALFARLLVPGTGLALVPTSLLAQAGVADVGTAATPLLRTSVSLYNGGVSVVDLGAGVVLSTGDSQPDTDNTINLYSHVFKSSSTDADLLAVARQGIADAVVRAAAQVQDVSALAGSFIVSDPAVRSVRIDIVFASECYPDLGRDVLGGIGAVFVNGTNHALFNGDASTPLSVKDTNNDGTMDQPVFLLSDQVTPYPFELDAVSRKLTVIAPVKQGSNVVKVAVGDVTDVEIIKSGEIADSALFVAGLQGMPFTSAGMMEVITGTGASDGMTGTARREFFDSGAGNDRITATGGNDLVWGGAGIDTLELRGRRTDYRVETSTEGKTFSVLDGTAGRDGSIEVSQLERLKFSDAYLALDLDGNAGITAKVLGAVFGKTAVANKQFVGIGLSLLDGGMDYTTLAGLALGAAGLQTPDQIVSALWRNVVGSPASDADKAPFIQLLQNGMPPGALAQLAADTSLNTVNINLVGLAQSGLEYLPAG